MSSISSLSIKPSNPPLTHQKTETVLSLTKSPTWNSNRVKSQDSSNQTFNSSNIQTKPSEATTSRPRPSEVSGPSATGGHHHQSSEGANRNEKPAKGNIIDAPTLEGVSSFFTDIKQSEHLHHRLLSIISSIRQEITISISLSKYPLSHHSHLEPQVRGSILRLVEEREQFKRENSTLRHYKAVCAKGFTFFFHIFASCD